MSASSAIVNVRHTSPVTLTIQLPLDVLPDDLVVTADENLGLITGPGPEGAYGGGYTFEPITGSTSGLLVFRVDKLGIEKSITINRDDSANPVFDHLQVDCR